MSGENISLHIFDSVTEEEIERNRARMEEKMEELNIAGIKSKEDVLNLFSSNNSRDLRSDNCAGNSEKEEWKLILCVTCSEPTDNTSYFLGGGYQCKACYQRNECATSTGCYKDKFNVEKDSRVIRRYLDRKTPRDKSLDKHVSLDDYMEKQNIVDQRDQRNQQERNRIMNRSRRDINYEIEDEYQRDKCANNNRRQVRRFGFGCQCCGVEIENESLTRCNICERINTIRGESILHVYGHCRIDMIKELEEIVCANVADNHWRVTFANQVLRTLEAEEKAEQERIEQEAIKRRHIFEDQCDVCLDALVLNNFLQFTEVYEKALPEARSHVEHLLKSLPWTLTCEYILKDEPTSNPKPRRSNFSNIHSNVQQRSLLNEISPKWLNVWFRLGSYNPVDNEEISPIFLNNKAWKDEAWKEDKDDSWLNSNVTNIPNDKIKCTVWSGDSLKSEFIDIILASGIGRVNVIFDVKDGVLIPLKIVPTLAYDDGPTRITFPANVVIESLHNEGVAYGDAHKLRSNRKEVVLPDHTKLITYSGLHGRSGYVNLNYREKEVFYDDGDLELVVDYSHDSDIELADGDLVADYSD
jgi:hypothetical protein